MGCQLETNTAEISTSQKLANGRNQYLKLASARYEYLKLANGRNQYLFAYLRKAGCETFNFIQLGILICDVSGVCLQ